MTVWRILLLLNDSFPRLVSTTLAWQSIEGFKVKTLSMCTWAAFRSTKLTQSFALGVHAVLL